MGQRTKKIVASEVLILIAFLFVSLIIYLSCYYFEAPITRIHPVTGEKWIIRGGNDLKLTLQLIATVFILMFPVRFTNSKMGH